MDTTFLATTPDDGRSTTAAREPLGQVILRNLDGDGCCPLDYLASAREATTGLAAFLLEHYELPTAVALELEAAQLAICEAELHLRMAAIRCS